MKKPDCICGCPEGVHAHPAVSMTRVCLTCTVCRDGNGQEPHVWERCDCPGYEPVPEDDRPLPAELKQLARGN